MAKGIILPGDTTYLPKGLTLFSLQIIESNRLMIDIFNKIRGRRFLLLIFLFFAANFLWSKSLENLPAQNQVELTIATGSEKGLYFRIGQEIAVKLREGGINVRVIPSLGSIQNLDLLSNNQVQLCIAQTDILIQKKSTDDIRALVPLYDETIHILIRNPLHVRHLRDLRGKRISVGPVGGGTEPNAIAILESAGISQNEASIVREDFDTTIIALQKGDLDAAFMMTGCPAPLIETLMKNNLVSLLKPDREVLDSLISENRGFVLSGIPAGTYENQYEEIETLGVPALLLARKNMDTSLAKNIVRIISNNIEDIKKKAGFQWNGPSVLDQLKRISVPLHSGAYLYFEEEKTSFSQKIPFMVVVIGVTIIFLYLIYWFFENKRWQKTKNNLLKLFRSIYDGHPLSRAVFFIILIICFGTLLMHWVEKDVNDNYSTLSLSIWSTLVNWINFGSKEPFSLLGKVVSTLMTLLGFGCALWLMSHIAAILIKKQMGGEHTMNDIDHFLIINLNQNTNAMVESIKGMKKEIDEKGNIFVIDEKAHETDLYEFKKYDPLSTDFVKKTNLNRAKSIIISSAENLTPEAADSRNVLIVMNIAKQLQDLKKNIEVKQPHIVVELQTSKNDHLLSFSGLNLEIVSEKSLKSKLIVQAAGNPGLFDLFEELLTYKEDSSEVHFIHLNEKLKTFTDVIIKCEKLRSDRNINIIPLAIGRRDDEEGLKVFLNPFGEKAIINKGDILYAVCDQKKDLDNILV